MRTFIEKVNNTIVTRLDGVKVNAMGIADPVVISEKDSSVVVPAVISGEDICTSVFFDDVNEIVTYHRVLSKQYASAKGFGDDTTNNEVFNNCLIVAGKRPLDQYDIDAICAQSLRDNADKYTKVEVTQSIFDRQSIFNSEYSGVEFPLQPNIFLIKISYKLTRMYSPCKNF